MRRLLLAIVLLLACVQPAKAQRRYSTSFPVNENPIVDGGNWNSGARDGPVGLNPPAKESGDIQTSGGYGYGTAISFPPPYTDSIGSLKGSWGINQLTMGIVKCPSSSPTTGVFKEIELHLRQVITSSNPVTTLEAHWACEGTNGGNTYNQFGSWVNLTTGTDDWSSSFAPGNGVNNGDVVMASITGAGSPGSPATVTIYRNGIVQGQSGVNGALYDTNDTAGAPGFGMYLQGGGSDRATQAMLTTFGLTKFFATDTFVIAASTSYADVQTAINDVADGGTVVLLTGTISWSSSFNYSGKNVVIMSAVTGTQVSSSQAQATAPPTNLQVTVSQ